MMRRRFLLVGLCLVAVTGCSQSNVPTPANATQSFAESARLRDASAATPRATASESPRFPVGDLIEVGDTFFGSTESGGAYNLGVVFTVNATTGAEATLHSFEESSSAQGGLVAAFGSVYGTLSGVNSLNRSHPNGTVFGVDQSTGASTLFYGFGGVKAGDAGNPGAGMIYLNGELYGTTQVGGESCALNTAGCGAVFEINPKTGSERVLYAFAGGADGDEPESRLIDMKGELYGTTSGGGSTAAACTTYGFDYGCGTVFEIDPSTGAKSVLYTFQGVDGNDPTGRLLAMNGDLYGTSVIGGTASPNAEGTVYSVDPTTNAETVLHSFPSYTGDGERPAIFGGLTNVNGKLYGVTTNGGAFGYGSIFKIDPTTSQESTIFSFREKLGIEPEGSLIDRNGELWGTAFAGGANDRGVVFKVSTNGTYGVVYAF